MQSLSPGSPNWADFFALDSGDSTYVSDREYRARRNRDVFRKAQSVVLSFSDPAIKSIQRSQAGRASFRRLFQRGCRHERR
jgi:hypothetical protein